jgi:hypothetical protein
MYLFVLFVVLGTAKVYEQTFTNLAFRKEGGWVYLDKMALEPGTA